MSVLLKKLVKASRVKFTQELMAFKTDSHEFPDEVTKVCYENDCLLNVIKLKLLEQEPVAQVNANPEDNATGTIEQQQLSTQYWRY